MLKKFVSETLEIFCELPGSRGCSESLLLEAESFFAGSLPPTYRRLMLLDEQRLCNTGIIVPVAKLPHRKTEAQKLLELEGFDFQLEMNHVVCGWNEVYSFDYFAACGNDDTCVYEFSYCGGDGHGSPVRCADTIPEYLATIIRRYLKLVP